MKPYLRVTTFLVFCFLFKNTMAQSCLGANTLTVTISNCAGIQQAGSPSFSVSPNPANATISIQFNTEENYELVLTDIAGKQLLVLKNVSNNYVINTSEYSNGIYFVRLQNEKNEVWVQKVEIQK